MAACRTVDEKERLGQSLEKHRQAVDAASSTPAGRACNLNASLLHAGCARVTECPTGWWGLRSKLPGHLPCTAQLGRGAAPPHMPGPRAVSSAWGRQHGRPGRHSFCRAPVNGGLCRRKGPLCSWQGQGKLCTTKRMKYNKREVPHSFRPCSCLHRCLRRQQAAKPRQAVGLSSSAR